ncbi:hypothetical protein M378DRAFT_8044, partial [Amanita muscaria Koide BX008]
MNGLEKFADEQMLYWFEVLSLMGQFDLAHGSIVAVLKLLTSTSSDLHRLLKDALHFIAKFHKLIKRSALHTYYSALPFTPTYNLLHRRYIKEVEHNICGIQGGPEKWNALIANLGHEERVQVVRFSLDGTLLVSYSDGYVDYDDIHKQGKLRIWDAATGTPISTITGHRFAATNDFSTVASFEDKTIMFSNMNGSPNGTMFTTCSAIRGLTLSSESGRVAAALSDGTVWLWDSGNAELIDSFQSFDGSEDNTNQPKFSPTGTRLAYSSAKGIVKLRDGMSGKFIADLQCGLNHEFEFSGDGSRIASVSYNDNLRLWNSQSGGLIAAIANVRWRCFAISANGSLLATADHCQDKVTLWSENGDHLAEIKVLQVCMLRSLDFSRDNILAIATFSDVELYNVKTHSSIHKLHFGRFDKALALSPDCTRLAVDDYEGNVNLWDIGIDASDSEGNATAVTALTLSRDCSRLACGFENALGFGPDGGLFASGSNEWDGGTIKLWNGKDGSLRGTLKAPSGLGAVALSDSVLVAAGDGGVTLWSFDTLSLIHTFTESSYEMPTLSIAENHALIAVAHHGGVSLLNAEHHRTITTFDVRGGIHAMAFLPDNQQLVAQSRNGVFLSFNLINKHIMKGATLEHLIQLPNISLWHGLPILHCLDNEQHYFTASQHKSPVPVLWIPRHIP